MYSVAKFEKLLADAKAEHRAAAKGNHCYPSDELFLRLTELGQAIEDGELPPSIMDKAERGASFIDKPSSGSAH